MSKRPDRASAAEKGKGIATSDRSKPRKRPNPPAAPVPDPSSDEEPQTTAPWPRPDGEPIPLRCAFDHMTITRHMLEIMEDYKKKIYGAAWADFNSLFYNGLLKMEMAPTRYIDPSVLQMMGIADPVRQLLANMGLGSLASRSHALYPELVRQCIASAEVFYERPATPCASEGKLTFLIHGSLHVVSIREICGIYGFDPDVELCKFTEGMLKELGPLWQTIASGPYVSRETKLTLVRNPVIRLVAKILSLTLFSKGEAGTMRMDELYLIALGIPALIDDIPWTTRPALQRVNLGGMFANLLADKKNRALGSTSPGKIETVGSMLTPIFQFCGIDLRRATKVDKIDYIDRDYLERCRILKGSIYRFCPSKGIVLHCRLPKPDWTSLDTLESLRFMLPQSELCTAKGYDIALGLDAPRASSSRPPPTATGSQRSDHPRDHTEYLLPPYTGEFDIPDISSDAPLEAQVAHLRQSNNLIMGMLTKIWGALSRVRCHPPPTCCAEPADVMGSPAPAPEAYHPATDDAATDDPPADPPVQHRSSSANYDSGHESDTT